MKRILITYVLISGIFILKAQIIAPSDSTSKRVTFDSTTKVETESEFPGGTKGWNSFLSSTLVYPKKAIRKNLK